MVEIPDLLRESDFFVGSDFLLEYKDRRLRSVILSYMDILSIVGPEKSESIFIEFRKTFWYLSTIIFYGLIISYNHNER